MSPRYLSIDADDRVLSSSSIAFDAASFEIWTARLNGATLICVDYETLLNPEAFADFIEHPAISVMWVTSALFDQLVVFRPGMFRRVKYLLSGGEMVNPKTVHKALHNAGGRPRAFVNGYGLTETGILATFQLMTELADPSAPLPIGSGSRAARPRASASPSAPCARAAAPRTAPPAPAPGRSPDPAGRRRWPDH